MSDHDLDRAQPVGSAGCRWGSNPASGSESDKRRTDSRLRAGGAIPALCHVQHPCALRALSRAGPRGVLSRHTVGARNAQVGGPGLWGEILRLASGGGDPAVSAVPGFEPELRADLLDVAEVVEVAKVSDHAVVGTLGVGYHPQGHVLDLGLFTTGPEVE